MYRVQSSFCFHESSYHSSELLLFQVFQLTTLVIRGPPTHGEKFSVSLDRVAVKAEQVRGVLFCVQDIVPSPHFTQRTFISESGFTMLSESIAIADSITSSPVYAPWSVVESASAGQVITDLCACWDRVVLRRRTAKDTSERWYHDSTPRNETASRSRMRASDVLEEGALSTCLLLRLLLVLLGQGKSVLPPASGREKSPRVRCSCHGDLKSGVLQLVHQGTL